MSHLTPDELMALAERIVDDEEDRVLQNELGELHHAVSALIDRGGAIKSLRSPDGDIGKQSRELLGWICDGAAALRESSRGDTTP